MFSNCVHSYDLIQNTQSKFQVLIALHIDIKSCLESTVCSLVHRYQYFRVAATSVFSGVPNTVYSLSQRTPLSTNPSTQRHFPKDEILHPHDCSSLLYTLPSKWRTSFFPHTNISITNVPQHEHCSQQKLHGNLMCLQIVCLWALQSYKVACSSSQFVSCWFQCRVVYATCTKSQSDITQFYMFKGLHLCHITWNIWLWIAMAS